MAEFQSSSFASQDSIDHASDKPKILIFSTAFLPMIGGAELAVKEITDRLQEHFDFVLFTSRLIRSLPWREKVGAVEVNRLGFGFGFDKYLLPILAYLRAKKIMKTFQPQAPGQQPIMWGIMASYGSIAAYFLKKKNPEIKFLLTLQEGDPEEYLISGRMGLMGFWLGKLIRTADKIQTISFYLKNLAVKLGADFKTAEVVPNGVDLDIFMKDFSPEILRELKIRHGVARNQKVVVTASRLVRKNAVDILIKAMAEVHDAHLFIAGVGFEEKKLKELARDLKIAKRIHFMGEMGHDSLSKYYALAHVFVRPSRSEGLGSAFLEAMGAGLPIVGTNVGGIPDFLKHNETGLFCEVDDPHDLSVKIKRFVHNENFRKKIAANAKKLIIDHYSWDKISRQMSAIFYRLLRP